MPPKDLLYMSAVGHTTREAFEAAREACKEHAVELLIIDRSKIKRYLVPSYQSHTGGK
jgi:hypothetical protein